MKVVNPGGYGDVKELDIELDGNDIVQSVITANIYMDVFSTNWTAVLEIDDTRNLLDTLPIKHGSTVTIFVETKNDSETDGTKNYTFRVAGIIEKSMQNQYEMTYKIICVDEDMIINSMTRVSKSYEGKISEIAQKVIEEELGASVEVQPASDNWLHCIAPNSSPFNFANWVIKMGEPSGMKGLDYILYQSDRGEYKIHSFEWMYESNDSGITFKQLPSDQMEHGSPIDDYALCFSHFETTHYDNTKLQHGGYYKSKTVTYDVIKKKWEEEEYTNDIIENKDWDSIYETAPSQVYFYPKHKGMSDINDTDVDEPEAWSAKRRCSLQAMDKEKLIIQLPGSAKCWEWIGKNCEVELPIHEDITDDKYDQHRAGKYVVTAIAQFIKKDSFVLNLELMKRELEKSDED